MIQLGLKNDGDLKLNLRPKQRFLKRPIIWVALQGSFSTRKSVKDFGLKAVEIMNPTTTIQKATLVYLVLIREPLKARTGRGLILQANLRMCFPQFSSRSRISPPGFSSDEL